HFKPFSVSIDLLGINEDPIASHEHFPFCPRSREVMSNWEAVHECEDERDADRLRKRVQLTAKNKALTASIGVGPEEDEIDFAFPSHSSLRSETDFRAQQAVLELQQSGWFEQQTVDLSCPTRSTGDCPASDGISRWIKQWKSEIKKQELTIASTRRNALNP
ncbi:hypothetical protein P692DRAFT_20695710, partial [Suillus brevipes Sb2]